MCIRVCIMIYSRIEASLREVYTEVALMNDDNNSKNTTDSNNDICKKDNNNDNSTNIDDVIAQ